MTDKIRVLIVDDEALARRGIRRLLEHETDFVVAGEAANGKEAAEAILRSEPDLVFLDIQMPLLDGLSVVDTMAPEMVPEVVFVTAYDEYAVRAFEAGAIDYVLKPINPQRFRKTLERVRRRVTSGEKKTLENRIHRLLSNLVTTENVYLNRVAIRHDERISFLNVDQIDWIRSQGNYIEIHSKGAEFLLRETISGIEKKLNPQEFLRIRRSTIVRVEGVKELHTMFNGAFGIVLRDGTELTSSRRYRKNLENFLKI
jgi:two-component system LytT family response regulator